MNEKQFNDAFTAAGGWFLLTQYEEIASWTGPLSKLIEAMYRKGFDCKLSGTKTRVYSILRIIENNREIDALTKIRDSKRINQMHPEAKALADRILFILQQRESASH